MRWRKWKTPVNGVPACFWASSLLAQTFTKGSHNSPSRSSLFRTHLKHSSVWAIVIFQSHGPWPTVCTFSRGGPAHTNTDITQLQLYRTITYPSYMQFYISIPLSFKVVMTHSADYGSHGWVWPLAHQPVSKSFFPSSTSLLSSALSKPSSTQGQLQAGFLGIGPCMPSPHPLKGPCLFSLLWNQFFWAFNGGDLHIWPVICTTLPVTVSKSHYPRCTTYG